jgi:hypothetical protein
MLCAVAAGGVPAEDPPRMRRCFLVLQLALPALAQGDLSKDQMREDLDQLARAVCQEWSYYEDKVMNSGLDLDALVADARREIDAADGAAGFPRILQRFVARLGDGHAGLEGGPPRKWPRASSALADCKEGIVQVPGGELLATLEGRPIEEWLAEIGQEVFASTPAMRRRLALSALGGGAEPAGTPNWSLTWPRDDVALWRIASFAVPRWKEWLAKPEDREPFLAEGRAAIDGVIEQLAARKARALILDLRGNGGGTDLLGIHLAERLLAKPFVYMRLSSKLAGKWTAPGGLTYGKGKHPRFAGKVLALVDAGCFSTTDNFLRCLDDLHPDFTTVGRPTGAGTGAPRCIATLAHSGARVTLCTMRVYGPRSGLIEGRSLVPDVPVQRSRADWRERRDPDLAAALATIETARR